LFIDRVCYRLPDAIRAEGGLLPHLDRNPHDPYLLESKTGLTKWRPIQGFVALTDQYAGQSCGLRCVRGFHREIDEYFARDEGTSENNQEKQRESGGEFYRPQHNKHRRLYERCQPVDCAAGAVVLWDNRIPHATAEEFASAARARCYTRVSCRPACVATTLTRVRNGTNHVRIACRRPLKIGWPEMRAQMRVPIATGRSILFLVCKQCCWARTNR
jgi:hypothetical protein